MMKPTPIRLPEPILERLDEIARLCGSNRSELVRTAAMEFVLRHGGAP